MQQTPNISIKDLAVRVETSEATIRRELKVLEENGLLELRYGKIMLQKSLDKIQYGLSDSLFQLLEATATTVQNGNVILLPPNKMNLLLARYLKEKEYYISIVTNSLSIFEEVKDSKTINSILLGGIFNRTGNYFFGNGTTSVLSTIRADKLITYPYGIDFQSGMLEDPSMDNQILSLMANQARKTIIYLSDENATRNAGILFADFSLINTVATTKSVFNKYQEKFAQYSLSIIISDK